MDASGPPPPRPHLPRVHTSPDSEALTALDAELSGSSGPVPVSPRPLSGSRPRGAGPAGRAATRVGKQRPSVPAPVDLHAGRPVPRREEGGAPGPVRPRASEWNRG